jgi:hypothetical protein
MVVILTADEFLRKGLELVGFDHRRQQQVCRATNLSRFKGHYGSNPNVYAQIWEDLQMTDEALEDSWKMDPDSFLMALHFLTRYPTEQEQAGIFKICEKTARSWTWIYARKIQALKKHKVSMVLIVHVKI